MASDSRSNDLASTLRGFLVLWGIPIVLLGIAFTLPNLQGVLRSVGYLWIGGACLANWIRCRRAHCVIMGPLFLILGLLSVSNAVGVSSIHWRYIGWAAGLSVLVSFLPECFGKKYFVKTPRP